MSKQDQSGRYSDESYREWWVSRFGKFVEQMPTDEQIEKMVNLLNNDREVGLSENVTVYRKLKNPRTQYILDAPPKKEYEYKLYYEMYERRAVFANIRKNHLLICDNINEVLSAVVRDYKTYCSETSEW
jgi:hypothetical protein